MHAFALMGPNPGTAQRASIVVAAISCAELNPCSESVLAMAGPMPVMLVMGVLKMLWGSVDLVWISEV